MNRCRLSLSLLSKDLKSLTQWRGERDYFHFPVVRADIDNPKVNEILNKKIFLSVGELEI